MTHCDLIVAKSKTVKEALVLEGWPEDKIVVNYYGIDDTHFYRFDETKGVETKRDICHQL